MSKTWPVLVKVSLKYCTEKTSQNSRCVFYEHRCFPFHFIVNYTRNQFLLFSNTLQKHNTPIRNGVGNKFQMTIAEQR
jgi:hypothetical protein